ncbi:cell division protein FtsN [Lonepinella sp. BR2919]|uniref:cell division protein FtsN n=1 Tax=unclassified Lonepinella TaxID=2642006 RepID=UPI003F6E2864
MAQRDYAARSGSKKKKSTKKSLLLAIATGVIVAFVLGLYLLKEKAPEPVKQNTPSVVSEEKDKHKSQLPSKLEETFSYIKELENRSITNSQPVQLSETQKAELKRLQEEEQARQAALEKLKQTETAKSEQTESTNITMAPNAGAQVVDAELTDVGATEPAVNDEAKLKAEQERTVAEQKKLADQRKKEEERKLAEQKKEESKKANTAKSTGKFGLQCGAFNDRAKAESLQARLAMSGLNARITESGKWNRVLVGPIGDRPAAVSAQQQASAVAGCVVIGM